MNQMAIIYVADKQKETKIKYLLFFEVKRFSRFENTQNRHYLHHMFYYYYYPI